MLVSELFFKNNYLTKKIYSSCRASKWQFPLALTELPLVNTSGRVQFSSPLYTDWDPSKFWQVAAGILLYSDHDVSMYILLVFGTPT